VTLAYETPSFDLTAAVVDSAKTHSAAQASGFGNGEPGSSSIDSDYGLEFSIYNDVLRKRKSAAYQQSVDQLMANWQFD
jgi:hypothetical protein